MVGTSTDGDEILYRKKNRSELFMPCEPFHASICQSRRLRLWRASSLEKRLFVMTVTSGSKEQRYSRI
jgi:hypothetical protein